MTQVKTVTLSKDVFQSSFTFRFENFEEVIAADLFTKDIATTDIIHRHQ